jgi:hypothetical protein
MPKPKEEPQVSPLRYAPVEMTIHFVDWVLRFGRTSNQCQTVLGVFLEKRNSADRMNCHLDRSVAQWRDLRFLLYVASTAR